MVVIPYLELSADALQGMLEEYVTRDGTDYGTVELSTEAKIARVKKQLENKKISIVFDDVSETCNILTQEELSQIRID